MLNLKPLRPKEGTDAAMKVIAAGLGNDLHYAARGLAVLRLVAAGLHIYFLNKRQIDAGGERAVVSGENPKVSLMKPRISAAGVPLWHPRPATRFLGRSTSQCWGQARSRNPT